MLPVGEMLCVLLTLALPVALPEVFTVPLGGCDLEVVTVTETEGDREGLPVSDTVLVAPAAREGVACP